MTLLHRLIIISNRTRLNLFLAILIITGISYLCIIYKLNFRTHEIANKVAEPLILAWTPFYGMRILGDLFLRGDKRKLKAFDQSKCPYKCQYSDSKERHAEASMIIFHIRDLNDSDLPPANTNRLNVFFLIESPAHTGSAYKYVPPNYFNLTFTYRKDSDIYWPNDSFEEIDQGTVSEDVWQEEEIFRKFSRKKKLAVQFVSNCITYSGRDIYVSELKSFINISDFGSCSKNPCPEEHLFYLAFENSVCKNYVTEKFWHLKRLIVPVVLSRDPFVGLKIPDGTYISAQDFAGPEKLAEYLLFLQNNPKEYLRYFRWTKKYRKGGRPNPLCELCRWAVEKRHKRIKDIVEWWEVGGDCKDTYVASLLPELGR